MCAAATIRPVTADGPVARGQALAAQWLPPYRQAMLAAEVGKCCANESEAENRAAFPRSILAAGFEASLFRNGDAEINDRARYRALLHLIRAAAAAPEGRHAFVASRRIAGCAEQIRTALGDLTVQVAIATDQTPEEAGRFERGESKVLLTHSAAVCRIGPAGAHDGHDQILKALACASEVRLSPPPCDIGLLETLHRHSPQAELTLMPVGGSFEVDVAEQLLMLWNDGPQRASHTAFPVKLDFEPLPFTWLSAGTELAASGLLMRQANDYLQAHRQRLAGLGPIGEALSEALDNRLDLDPRRVALGLHTLWARSQPDAALPLADAAPWHEPVELELAFG